MPESPSTQARDRSGGSARSVASMVTTAEGWLQSVTPQMAAILVRSSEQLTGLNWFDRVHPHDIARVRQSVAACLSNGDYERVELRMWLADDAWRAVVLLLRPGAEGELFVDLGASPIADTAQDAVSSSPGSPTAAPDDSTAATAAQAVAAAQFAPASTSVAEPVEPPVAPDPVGLPIPAGQDVPAARAAVRARAGMHPMAVVEIDGRGRAVYVGGDWAHVSSIDQTGWPALKSFLDERGVAEQADQAIAAAIERAATTEVALMRQSRGSAAEAPPDRSRAQRIVVEPIPSPDQAGARHAFVALHADAADRSPTEPGTANPQTADAAVEQVGASSTSRLDSTLASVGTPSASHQTLAATRAGTGEQVTTTEGVASATTTEPEPALGIVERFRRWTAANDLRGLNGAMVLAVLVVALVLRVWDLAELPTGFHGDEAITGQEAQRVLDQGSIGVYTGSALGQPTGPFYLHAIATGLFGPTVWATRIVAAVAGVIATGAIYLIVQRRFDHRVGFVASLAFATMTWSIHFGRIAFGLAWWPLVIVAAIALVDRATTTGERRDWLYAGALAAFGVYIYNSHWSFGFSVALFMVLWMISPKRTGTQRFTAAVYGPIGAFVVLIPMLWFMLGDNGYFNHFDQVSRRSRPDWTEAGFFGKVDAFISWYFESWNTLLFSPRSDSVDGSGVIGQVPLVFTVFALIGLVVVLRRHRTAFIGLLLVCLVVVPIAPSLTIDALTRRNYALAPLIAILAGVGAVAAYDIVRARIHTTFAEVLAVAVGVVVVFTSVVPYFTTFRDNESQRWVFAEELTTSVDAIQIAELDGPVFVNWYSARHYYNYSTLEFLLDGTPGVDRAPLDLGFDENPSLSLDPSSDRDQVFVLVGPYADNLGDLEQLYPQGRVIVDQQTPRMVTFEVPAG